MHNVMAILPNIGVAICSTPQSLADAHTRLPCSDAAKTRKPFKFAGCPKPANGSQPLVNWSSPYCERTWKRYCCLTSFFPIVDTYLSCIDITRQNVRWCPDGEFLAIFWFLHFQRAVCSTFQTCILQRVHEKWPPKYNGCVLLEMLGKHHWHLYNRI